MCLKLVQFGPESARPTFASALAAAVGTMACLVPAFVLALGLGEIELASGLNEPLDARIEIISATPAELNHLAAKVASLDTFRRYGLDRPDFLANLRFNVEQNAAGQPVLRVTSGRPIPEPFVTFLVEAQWSKGRLLREYTVLLDPPVFMPAAELTAPPPVIPPRGVRAQPEPDAGTIRRAPPTETRSAPPPRAAAASFGAEYGPVRRNETLWGIASRLRDGTSASMNQVMIAIYRANPEAFLGNINLLKEGAVLRLPDRGTLGTVGQREAFAEAVRHNEAWRQGRPTPQAAGTAVTPTARSAAEPEPSRLRLVAPEGEEGGAAAGRAAGATDTATREAMVRNQAEIERLSTENDQLRADLDDVRRLISLKDTELAEFQARLAEQQASSPQIATRPTPALPVPDVAVPGDPAVTPDPAIVDTGTTVPALTPDGTPDLPGTETPEVSEPAPTTTAERPPIPVVRTLPAEPGFIEKTLGFFGGLLSSLWLWVGLGLVALTAFGIVALRGRDSGASEAIETLTREAAAVPDHNETVATPAQPPAGAEADDVEYFDDSGTFKPVDFAAAQADPETAEYPFEDTMGVESSLKLDQSDPLAEADFHMAYGLYDQAAELVRKAAEREPDRRDLPLKLLEIFFVWGNKEEFSSTAHRVYERMGESLGGEWDKILIMGKQICPEDDLFAAEAGMAGIDLEFDAEGGDAEIDLVTGTDEAVFDDGVDLDFGEALAASPALDATQLGQAIPPSEVNLVDGDALDFDFGSEESDTPETEAETAAIKDQIQARLASSDSDETAEMDLNDLGVDLDLGADPAPNLAGPVETGSAPDPGSALDATDFDDLFAESEPVSSTDETSELPAEMPSETPTGMPAETPLSASDTATSEIASADKALDFDMDAMFAQLDGNGDDETARDLQALEESMASMAPEEHGENPDEANARTAAPDADDETGHFSAEIETLAGDSIDLDIGGFADTATGADVTRLLGPDDTPLVTEDEVFSESVFGGSEDETVQVNALDPDALPGETEDGDPFGEIFAEDSDDAVDILDLDIGESLGTGEDRTTTKVATAELALPDGNGELNEVGTKLDLARAYVDMGDPAGARGILEEVLEEGDESQQADARDMLESLG